MQSRLELTLVGHRLWFGEGFKNEGGNKFLTLVVIAILTASSFTSISSLLNISETDDYNQLN